jgi:hypothetical protein
LSSERKSENLHALVNGQFLFPARSNMEGVPPMQAAIWTSARDALAMFSLFLNRFLMILLDFSFFFFVGSCRLAGFFVFFFI